MFLFYWHRCSSSWKLKLPSWTLFLGIFRAVFFRKILLRLAHVLFISTLICSSGNKSFFFENNFGSEAKHVENVNAKIKPDGIKDVCDLSPQNCDTLLICFLLVQTYLNNLFKRWLCKGILHNCFESSQLHQASNMCMVISIDLALNSNPTTTHFSMAPPSPQPASHFTLYKSTHHHVPSPQPTWQGAWTVGLMPFSASSSRTEAAFKVSGWKRARLCLAAWPKTPWQLTEQDRKSSSRLPPERGAPFGQRGLRRGEIVGFRCWVSKWSILWADRIQPVRCSEVKLTVLPRT